MRSVLRWIGTKRQGPLPGIASTSRALVLAGGLLWLAGCGTPPSVSPPEAEGASHAGQAHSTDAPAPTPPPAPPPEVSPEGGGTTLADLARLLPEPKILREEGTLEAEPRRRALLIAADQYRISSPEIPRQGRLDWNLPAAAQSAERMRQALVDEAGFAPEDVQVLAGAQVRRADIEGYFRDQLGPTVRPGDLVLVYYCGHGMHDGARGAALFLYETREDAVGRFVDTLSYSDLQRWMTSLKEEARKRGGEDSPPVTTVTIVDACRINVAAPPPNVVIEATSDLELFSARAGQFAHAGHREFVFTAALSEAMRTRSSLGEIDLVEAFQDARTKTEEEIASQVPEKLGRATALRLPTRRGVRVSARALDGVALAGGSRAAVPGARILWNGRERAGEDAAGAVSTLRLQATTYTLTVDAPGYLTYQSEVTIAKEDDGRQLEIPLFPAFELLELELTDGTGRPLAAARVEVTGVAKARGDYHVPSAVTGPDGKAVLKLPPRSGGEVLVVSQVGTTLLRRPIGDVAPTRTVARDGLQAPVSSMGRIPVEARADVLPEVAVHFPPPTAAPGALELGVKPEVVLDAGLDLPAALRPDYDAARRFLQAKKLERVLDKVEQLAAQPGELPPETKLRLASAAEQLRLGLVLEAASQSRKDGLDAIATHVPHTTGEVAEALERIRANLDLAEWERDRVENLEAAAGALEARRKDWRSSEARRVGGAAMAGALLERARAARSAGDLEGALKLATWAGSWAETKTLQRELLLELARLRFDARAYREADAALERSLALTPPAELEEIAARRRIVRATWLRAEVDGAYTTGDWDAARKVLVETRALLGDSPALQGLDAEIERECISPDSRKAMRSANDAFARGDLASWREAEKGYEGIRGSLNEHYRGFVESQLEALGSRIYATLTNAGVEAEIADQPIEAFEAALERLRYRPVLAGRDLESLWNGYEEVRTRFAHEESVVREVGDWKETRAAETQAGENFDAIEGLWESFLARNPRGRLEGAARERLELAGIARKVEEERREAERREAARREMERRGPSVPGFSNLGPNAQGYPEYCHAATGINFVLLPGGKFSMGSPDSEEGRDADEGPLHEVELSPFLIAKYEVTQAQWQKVMGSNPSQFKNAGFDAPVENVSWEDCQEFCRKTGLRLPSEAQWEYACRGGTSSPYSTKAWLYDVGWYDGNSSDSTHLVGQKQPNGFGLHDMHGNVWEWCEDLYDEAFYQKPAALGKDPVSSSGFGVRVDRGGGWFSFALSCRSGNRNRDTPSNRSSLLGFRPAASFP